MLRVPFLKGPGRRVDREDIHADWTTGGPLSTCRPKFPVPALAAGNVKAHGGMTCAASGTRALMGGSQTTGTAPIIISNVRSHLILLKVVEWVQPMGDGNAFGISFIGATFRPPIFVSVFLALDFSELAGSPFSAGRMVDEWKTTNMACRFYPPFVHQHHLNHHHHHVEAPAHDGMVIMGGCEEDARCLDWLKINLEWITIEGGHRGWVHKHTIPLQLWQCLISRNHLYVALPQLQSCFSFLFSPKAFIHS